MQSTHANAHIDLQKLLFQYRNTPHSVTGIAPAEMLFSRKIRTQFDLLRPSSSQNKVQYERPFNFPVGKRVSCRNYTGSTKWLFGTVTEQIGDLHYKIRLDDGRDWKRHINQMRPIGENTPKSRVEDSDYSNYDYSNPSSVSDNSSTIRNASDTSNPSDRTTVNVSPPSASPDSPSRTPVNGNNNTPPSTRGPSYSTFTATEADSFLFSTPQGFWAASTPKPSSPASPTQLSEPRTPSPPPPVKKALRPPRQIHVPKYLDDYVLGKS